jgi:RNA polymerase sigma factor (sigma-70 family)
VLHTATIELQTELDRESTSMAKMPSTKPELLEKLRAALRKLGASWGPAENSAWHEYVHMYQNVLVDFGRRRGLKHEDCEEMAQRTLLDAANQIMKHGYDPELRFRDLLTTIAQNRCADFGRRQRRRAREQQAPSSTVVREKVDDKAIDPPEAAIGRERVAALLAAIGQLRQNVTERDFTLLVETRIKQRPIVEVARELQISSEAARKMLGRLQDRLLDILRNQFGFEDW